MKDDVRKRIKLTKMENSLKIACDYPKETEMDSETVDRCLKILGS